MSVEARGVICDMDGLLIDSEPLYKRAWQSAARELGVDISDAMYDGLVGRTEADSEQALVETFGASFPMAEFRRKWKAIWGALITSGHLHRMPGAKELLDKLRERAIPLALATSSTLDYVTPSLTATDLSSYFDAIVTVDAVEHGKPAPDIYLLAAERLDLPPASCVVLEDSEAGTRAAIAAGMRVFVVPDLVRPSAEALASATGVFETLELASSTLLRAFAREAS